MYPTPEETLRDYRRISRKHRAAVKADPQYAVEFLLRAGIIVRDETAEGGLRLADRYR